MSSSNPDNRYYIEDFVASAVKKTAHICNQIKATGTKALKWLMR